MPYRPTKTSSLQSSQTVTSTTFSYNMLSNVPPTSSVPTISPTATLTTVTSSSVLSQTTPQLKLTTQFEDMPLHALLGMPVHEMSPDELQKYVSHMRACRTSAPTLSASLRKGSKPKKEPKVVKNPFKSQETLLGEYDV